MRNALKGAAERGLLSLVACRVEVLVVEGGCAVDRVSVALTLTPTRTLRSAGCCL